MVNSNLKLIWFLALSFSGFVLGAQEGYEGYKSFASLEYPRPLINDEIFKKTQILPMIHMDRKAFSEHLEESAQYLVDKEDDKVRIYLVIEKEGKIRNCMAGSLNGSSIDTVSLRRFVEEIQPFQPAKQRDQYVNIQAHITLDYKKGKVVDYRLDNLMLSE
ncbi:MAG: hypothetical protein IPL23_21650 [Saprospiraceae bacterium]|nr:hypothetical protein [Saprospiraceae bacterium]